MRILAAGLAIAVLETAVSCTHTARPNAGNAARLHVKTSTSKRYAQGQFVSSARPRTLSSSNGSLKLTRASGTYACGGPDVSRHCYAIATWSASNGDAFGFFSADVSLVDLSAQPSQFLDDELWLIDKSCEPGVICWIEAGFMSNHVSTVTQPQYFWAYQPPNGLRSVYYLSVVDRTGYGKPVHIQLDGRGGTFHIQVTPPGQAVSFSKNAAMRMKPNLINLGQELSGTRGSRAPKATFTRIYAGLRQPGNALSATVQLKVDKPPFGGWEAQPGSSGKAIFYTQCC
jgi:hypothetical protein